MKANQAEMKAKQAEMMAIIEGKVDDIQDVCTMRRRTLDPHWAPPQSQPTMTTGPSSTQPGVRLRPTIDSEQFQALAHSSLYLPPSPSLPTSPGAVLPSRLCTQCHACLPMILRCAVFEWRNTVRCAVHRARTVLMCTIMFFCDIHAGVTIDSPTQATLAPSPSPVTQSPTLRPTDRPVTQDHAATLRPTDVPTGSPATAGPTVDGVSCGVHLLARYCTSYRDGIRVANHNRFLSTFKMYLPVGLRFIPARVSTVRHPTIQRA